MNDLARRYILLLSLLAVSLTLHGQSDSSVIHRSGVLSRLTASVGLQLWTTYTTGMKVFNRETQRYELADNRLNAQIRRTRLSLKGSMTDDLSFQLTAAIDLVGKDLLAATEAGGNNGSAPGFRLWNAYVQWRLLPKKESLNLVAGYQVLPIGRESITAALRSTSMEKAWSQNYLRRHLTGIGPGRAVGLQMGGLLPGSGSKVQLEYSIGLFNPVFETFGGNSTGLQNSPLLIGRAVVHLGEPESKQYSLNHKINYFGQRKGISLAFALAEQGRTDLFRENRAVGGDILFNYGPLNVDGEYYYLYRSSPEGDSGSAFSTDARTAHIRMSYNLRLPGKMILEPVATYWLFKGPMRVEEQELAEMLKSFAGEDESLDLGSNFYWTPDLKISLHYTWRWGDSGEAGDGATFNNYFYQSGLGAIRRGDWLGLGLVMII